MKIFYFTATGNNLYIAKRLGGERYSIPQLLKEEKVEFKDEQIGFVFPVYMIVVPSIVEEFLNKVKLESSYIFAVISYGNYAGAAATQLLEIGERNGIKFSYVNEILMVDSYLPVFDINQQVKDEPKKNIEENLDRIINDVNRRYGYVKKDPVITRYATKFIRRIPFFMNKPTFDKKFSVEDGCIGCGICVKVCPAGNIELANKRPEFHGRCINCLACTNNCPKNVIRLKGEKSKARFVNQNVSTKEIMEANSKFKK
jgi:ferredoxin